MDSEGWTVPGDDWTALKERLEAAVPSLHQTLESYRSQSERERVRGKIEGVKLALSYMQEQERVAGYE